MNSFQQTGLITRLKEQWAAMDADDLPLDSETRWSWCLVVGQLHIMTGCADNRFCVAFEDELHKVGCIFQRDRMGKIVLHAKRDKVNVKQQNNRAYVG